MKVQWHISCTLINYWHVSDVNECDNGTMNACYGLATCENVEGGYQCSCPVGFMLDVDNRSCSGELDIVQSHP